MALPLAEFNGTYDGPPADAKVLEARKNKLPEELAPVKSPRADWSPPGSRNVRPDGRLRRHPPLDGNAEGYGFAGNPRCELRIG